IIDDGPEGAAFGGPCQRTFAALHLPSVPGADMPGRKDRSANFRRLLLRWAVEGAGIALAAQYREQGLNLLHEFSHYVEGTGQKSVSFEAGLRDMLTRMQSGRFKVFKHHNDWWEEFLLYHRKDDRVVKEGDDLMAATRYANHDAQI